MRRIIFEKDVTLTFKTFVDEPVTISIYDDGIIIATCPSGEPFAKIAPYPCNTPNHALIKNWFENEGILEEMVRLGICKDTGTLVPTGMTNFNLVELTLDKISR